MKFAFTAQGVGALCNHFYAKAVKMDAEKNFSARSRGSKKRTRCKYCDFHLNPRLETISIPGLPRLQDPTYGRCYKSIWLLTVLLCTIACIYFTFDRMDYYFKGPVTTRLFIERNHKVQFPAFSICYYEHTEYINSMKYDIKEALKLENIDDKFIFNVSLPELNLSEIFLWDADYANVSVSVESLNATRMKANYNISHVHTAIGNCVVIRHTEEIPYFSARTELSVTIRNKYKLKSKYIFIPHALENDDDHEFDVLHHESEFLKIGYHTQFRLQEEMFKLQNTSQNVCYDGDLERKRVKQCAMSLLPSTICRLPFLPDSYPDCQTLTDVEESAKKINEILESLLHEVNCSIRQLCQECVYAVSMDFIHKEEHEHVTKLTLKFIDDTTLCMSEEFSYVLADLISDLFAYWGFFLCLSALVFVEIFDYFLRKICYWSGRFAGAYKVEKSSS